MEIKEDWKPGRVLSINQCKTKNYPEDSFNNYYAPLNSQVEELANIDQNGKATPSTAVFDTGASSSCGKQGNDLINTGEPSHKTFHLPTGHTAEASTKAKLHHNVRDPARNVEMVPDLQHNSLISGPKFADANYITVLTPNEVLIYDGDDLQISVNKDATLRGWRE